MNRMKENAHRLAGVLERYSEDDNTVKQLAALLNYLPGQLRTDMRDVLRYINSIEDESSD